MEIDKKFEQIKHKFELKILRKKKNTQISVSSESFIKKLINKRKIDAKNMQICLQL